MRLMEVARDEEETVSLARECGFPVVLKVNSPKVVHKSDGGGVFLNLKEEQSVREAFRKIMKNYRDLDLEATVTVQSMLRKGVEVLIGTTADRQFGPVVAFGLGGIFTEVLKDIVFRMAPISPVEAGKMVRQIKGSRLLQGYRGNPAVSLQNIIMRVSRLAFEIEDIAEMDLNPVVAFPHGAQVLDAQIKLK